MNRRSLRTSLSLAVVGLTALGLLVAMAASLLGLRADLVSRTDAQLDAAARLVLERSALLPAADPGDLAALRAAVAPTDYVVEVRREGGTTRRVTGGADLPVGGLLDGVAPGPGAESRVRVVGPPGHRYRVLAVRERGLTVAVGLPAAPIREAVRRLARVEALTAAAVLAGVALASRLLVALALRPLEEVTALATDIARHGPDAERPRPPSPDRPRPPSPDRPRPPGSETLRLHGAVQGMLARLRYALAERDASQLRLRTFVADASHELRTPLTTVRGYLQLVGKDAAVPADRRELLARADAEAGRMAALVDDLLYLARLDAGHPAHPGTGARDVPARVDLAALARDGVADMLAVQPGRPVHLSAPQSLVVPGDEAALRRLVTNLLGNVRAHTPPEAEVVVAVLDQGTTVVLQVRDAGPGIPPELAGRATDRFARAGRSAGSGLGLAIVADVVAAHHGKLEVRSPLDLADPGADGDPARGAGTLVQVRLPGLPPDSVGVHDVLP